jgi:hypothetical protein
MNRMCAAAWLLVLMLKTGCPVGGGAGVLHEALLRDEMKRLALDSCQPQDIEEVCGPDGFDECMLECTKRLEMRRRK